MPDTAIASPLEDSKLNNIIHIFNHYTSGAITAATTKYEWVVPYYCHILDVIVDSETAATGHDDDIIDVNLDGTSIFTTQANRPRLISNNTGMWSHNKPDVETIVPGQILSYDVDQVGSGGGSQRVKVIILVGVR